MAQVEVAQRRLYFSIPTGVSYIDLAEALSKVNRRSYRQGMQYGVEKIEYFYLANVATTQSVMLFTKTAGSTWVAHNAWRKAQAHWIQQQRRARRLIGQSAKPAYEDFKVYLDDAHRTGTSLPVLAGDGGAVNSGEWDYSLLIHEADDASVDEWYLHLIGGHVSTTDKGLILGYQNSRATIQPEDPDLPAEYSTNMYALMAQDVDAVADEVAQNMEDQNDEPPYDQDDYPGSDANCDDAWVQNISCSSSSMPCGIVPPFVAQCGLIKFLQSSNAPDGSSGDNVNLMAVVTIAPGSYRGVLAEPMGQ